MDQYLLVMLWQQDAEHRCSETGYRVPLKCLEIKEKEKKESGMKSRRSLNALESGETKNQVSYTTYRSCLPAEAEERLSFLGFEVRFRRPNFQIIWILCPSGRFIIGVPSNHFIDWISFVMLFLQIIMLCLFLVSGFSVLVRQKRNIPFLGIGAARFPFGSSRV